MTTNSIADLEARYGPNYRWYVTSAAIMGTIALALTSTIINVAIPDVMGTFGIGQDKAQWLSTGFLAAMTGFMLLNAWLVESFGARATYMFAMSIFVTGSLLGGFSPNADLLILARILQGGGAGLSQPLAMLVLFRVFPAEKRGTAMGIYSIGVVLAPAVGPTLGGMIIDAFNWRYVFFLALPFCVIGSVLAAFFMPTRARSGPRPDFDWTGLILMAIFLGTLLTGLSNGQRNGWYSDSTYAYLGIAITSACAFLFWEMKARHPMLDLRLFANRNFASAAVIGMVFGAGMFGSFYLVPLFVQTLQGYTATRSGLLLMPGGFAMVLAFPLAGKLSDKLPNHLPIIFGLLCFAWSSFLMASADIHTSFWIFAWWVLLGRIGLSFIVPALTVGALRTLPPEQLSQGSGTINFVRQLGGAFGVNLLAIAVERRTALYADNFAAGQTPDNGATREVLTQLTAQLGQSGASDTQRLSEALYFLGRMVYNQAAMIGFRDGFMLIAIVSALAVIPALLLGVAARRNRADALAATL